MATADRLLHVSLAAELAAPFLVADAVAPGAGVADVARTVVARRANPLGLLTRQAITLAGVIGH